ncbi:MAG: DNA polymerase III subunit beta [Bdellovibrionales bacterium]
MKIEIDKNELINLLGKTQNIVEKRNTMPVLVNVLLEATGDSLKVFATDLEVSLTDQVNVNVLEQGKVAVSAKNLFDIIKELPDGQIRLEKKENNWLEISQGKSLFNIVGIGAEEYPVFPTFSTNEFLETSSTVLKEMIEKTIYSVSNDETRYHLNGVYFENQGNSSNTYRMVSTDGHRLSLVDRIPTKNNSNSSASGVIIPRKGLNEIRKMLDNSDDLQLAFEGSQLIVKNQETILMVRLIEGKYPNYSQLIPQNLKTKAVVDKDRMLASLKRVSLLSNQKSKGVTLNFDGGTMKITSNNPELGDAKEEMEINYNGESMKIGFNAKYLMDVLTSINDETVDIELNDQISPALIKPSHDPDYRCVVMPMRL